jgi:hypothetical protein
MYRVLGSIPTQEKKDDTSGERSKFKEGII